MFKCQKIISTSELLQRWSMAINRLKIYVGDEVLQAYRNPQRLLSNQGGYLYYSLDLMEKNAEKNATDFNEAVYDLWEVEQYEKKWPELLDRPLEEPRTLAKITEQPAPSPAEQLTSTQPPVSLAEMLAVRAPKQTEFNVQRYFRALELQRAGKSRTEISEVLLPGANKLENALRSVDTFLNHARQLEARAFGLREK